MAFKAIIFQGLKKSYYFNDRSLNLFVLQELLILCKLISDYPADPAHEELYTSIPGFESKGLLFIHCQFPLNLK